MRSNFVLLGLCAVVVRRSLQEEQQKILYSVRKNVIVKSMGELTRTVVAGVFVHICVVLCLCVAMAAWVHNKRQYDDKMTSMLIFDSIRIFNETGAPYAISYRYVGSTKTKTFHTFESKCAREIRSTQLTSFDSTEDAIKAGYSQCTMCKP